jgi:hypothetical protein
MRQWYACGSRNLWTPASVEETMLNMRMCAVLALSVAGIVGPVASAHAASYCNDPDTYQPEGCVKTDSPQHSLDLAAAHPGHDDVVIGPATYDVDGGLSYSDGGIQDNDVTIRGWTRCSDRYTCHNTRLTGSGAGTVLLSFDVGATTDVVVDFLYLEPRDGATGLALPPGGTARGVSVYSPGDAIGVRMDGTADRPAVLRGYLATTGGIGVDAPGYGILEDVFIRGGIGARVRGAGSLDIRGGQIAAVTGVTGPRARVFGTLVSLDPEGYEGDPVGVEAVCPGPAAADAEIEVTNVTIAAGSRPGATGVRAVGRGGDGESCGAAVRMSSTAIHAAAVSLDARGEVGSGADPRGGATRIDAAYSSFSVAAIRQAGPSEVERSTPGQNIDGDPLFINTAWLRWDSPLIDRGDPAPLESWQAPWHQVINGRRDIGWYEYRFESPQAIIEVAPGKIVPVGKRVRLISRSSDGDFGDTLDARWALSDGRVVAGDGAARRYAARGTYYERLTVTDPTGRGAETTQRVRVVRQRLSELRLRPRRIRPSKFPHRVGRTRVELESRAFDDVVCRFRRAVRRPGSRRVRWKRVRGVIRVAVDPGRNTFFFNGWAGERRLRPGRYRMVVRAKSTPRLPVRAPFRIVR